MNQYLLIEAIKKAQQAGIRFMIATGRSFEQAMHALKDADIECDYIVSSGAEVRNERKEPKIRKRSRSCGQSRSSHLPGWKSGLGKRHC